MGSLVHCIEASATEQVEGVGTISIGQREYHTLPVCLFDLRYPPSSASSVENTHHVQPVSELIRRVKNVQNVSLM